MRLRPDCVRPNSIIIFRIVSVECPDRSPSFTTIVCFQIFDMSRYELVAAFLVVLGAV
jgi:hypothetical protein